MKGLFKIAAKKTGLILLTIFLFFYLLGFLRHGIGITPDSTSYLLSAKNFIRTFSFYETNNQPLVEWPFFYPFALAGLKILTKLEWNVVVFLLNTVCFVLCFYLSLRLFYILVPGAKLKSWYEVAFFGFPTAYVFAFAWSEPVFNVLSLLLFIELARYLKDPETASIFKMSLISVFNVLTRYAGLFLVAGVSITLFIYWFLRKEIKKAFYSAFSYSLLPLTSISFWFYRNFKLTGTFAGPRPDLPIFTYSENLYNFIDQIAAWFIPHKLPDFFASFVYGKPQEISVPLVPRVIFIAVVISLMLYFVLKNKGLPQMPDSLEHVYALLSVTPFVYTVCILMTSTKVYFETNRFLSPIYPLLMIYAAIFLSRFLENIQAKYGKKALNLLVVVLMVHSLYFPFSSFLRIVQPYLTEGLGVNSTSFKTFISKVIQYKQSIKPSQIVTDNASMLEYLVSFENMAEISTVYNGQPGKCLIILFKPHTSLSKYLAKDGKIITSFERDGIRVFFVETESTEETR